MPTPGDAITPLPTREGYDRWASTYDVYDNPLIALEQPVVRDRIGSALGLDVLDVGCGTGRHAHWMARQGAKVTGIDFSGGMLEQLRGKDAPAIEVVEHDLTQGLPQADATADLVTCCLVLEHLPALDLIFAEMGRVCRPGGRVLISDFHPEMLRRGYHARFREAPGGPKFQMHGEAHTISDYVMAATRAGLSIVHISEHTMTQTLAASSRSAQKWVGLPLLFVLECSRLP
ncbi:MAG: class I SAM-dependent methyltransferase [Nannocystaceae bacterium]|nr:class I SAM-dependent methyltransferase [Nannocystaceae bacterium]